MKDLLTGTRRWPLGILLVAAALAPALVTDNPYYLRLAIQYGAIYAIVLAGLNVLIGATGQVSLGHVGIFATAAYAGAYAGSAGLPWVVTAIAAVVTALCAGLVIGFPALRLRGAYLALTTLAFGLLVIQLISAIPRVVGGPGATATVVDVPRPVLGPIVLAGYRGYYVFCVLLAAPMVALARNVFWSHTGRQLQAVRDHEGAASSLGISIVPSKLGAFLFSAALAGLAGALYASFDPLLSPDNFKAADSIAFVIALLIGGLAAPVAGPVLGAAGSIALVYLGQTYFRSYQALLTALVFFAIVAFAPRGLGGLLRRTPLRHLLPGPGETLVATATRARGTGTVRSPIEASGTGADATAVVAVGLSAREGGDTHAVAHPAGTVLVEHAPLLEVRQIAKSYGGVRAVDGVDFLVKAGEIHVLMGPNGSGKSTCLDVVCGLVPADRGSVLLCGDDISTLPAHKRARAGVARTFQEIRLFPTMTVLENAMVGNPSRHRAWRQVLRTPGVVGEELEHAEEALALLEAWGLGEFAARQASELSYGQRKMLELARAASRRPRILLVDEPSAGLNPRWVSSMVDALKALRDAGHTLLVVEHHQDLIADLADAVTVLDNGVVIAEGPPAAVQRDQRVVDVYLGPSAARLS